MNKGEKYLKILTTICNYYGLTQSEFITLLANKETKYILLLLLKKNKCMDKEKMLEILNLKSVKSVNYNIQKAEEKLLINREFREKFFEIEEGLLK